MTKVDYSTRGRIAVIAFQSPPVNSLGFSLRRDLLAALEYAALWFDQHIVIVEADLIFDLHVLFRSI